MYHICVDSKKVMTGILIVYTLLSIHLLPSANSIHVHTCNPNSFPIPCLNIIVALEELGRIYCIWIYLRLAKLTHTHTLQKYLSAVSYRWLFFLRRILAPNDKSDCNS